MKEVTVIYLRLSKEDELVKDESNSITNQRRLLEFFIHQDAELRNTEVIEIKDDGYSGKIMERPGMTRLLEMIRKKQVQHIVVKDFSRFSRDYLVLGKYVEQIFPFMGITFVAVNDYYDSRKCQGGITELDMSMKALLYDFYSEDLSVKVKSALKTRRDSGKYIAAFAPYGYRKCQDDKHSLEIDAFAADIVRRIFRDYVEGKSMYRIAKELNQEGISSPGKYIEERDGGNYSNGRWADSGWGVLAISRILHNEVYLGTVVYNRNPDMEAQQRATVNKPKEEWSRHESCHEAIIDQKTFDLAQDRLKKNSKKKAVQSPSPFVGKVFCASCGYRMSLNRGGRSKFFCSHKYRIPDESEKIKCADAIREEDLMEIVKTTLSEKMMLIEDKEKLMAMEKKRQQTQVRSARNKLSAMEETLEKVHRNQMDAYEAYRDGRIDKETYLQQKEMYEGMEASLRQNVKQQVEACSMLSEEKASRISWYRTDGSIDAEEVSRELVDTLIDRIEVGKNQEVNIVWKFRM